MVALEGQISFIMPPLGRHYSETQTGGVPRPAEKQNLISGKHAKPYILSDAWRNVFKSVSSSTLSQVQICFAFANAQMTGPAPALGKVTSSNIQSFGHLRTANGS